MDPGIAVRLLWVDKATVYVVDEVKDPVTKVTSKAQRVLFADIPCKLSFQQLFSAGDDAVAQAPEDGIAASVSQNAALFLDMDMDIPAGSRISVEHGGRVLEYQKSGEPGYFPITRHQEIRLKALKGWA